MLSFLPFKAPSEYSFIDPDTGHLYQADSKQELVTKIVAYREQNNLAEIFQLGAVIDNYLCGLPANIGKCGRNQKLERSWWTTLKGGVALLVEMRYSAFVDRAEANRRAAICVGCPKNVFRDKGPFVKRCDQIAEACTGGLRSSEHDQLGNCEVCTCTLKAKVWYAGKIDLTEEQLAETPDFCWQKELYHIQRKK